MITIKIPQNLTSFEFYNSVLPQISNIDFECEQELLFDLSETHKIEPLTIPNLLCLGQLIKSKCGRTPSMYIPDTTYSGKVKNYLDQIGFLKYSIQNYIFYFINDPYGGHYGRRIDPLCRTFFHSESSTEDVINRTITYFVVPFADSYLRRFRTDYNMSNLIEENEITRFIQEMIVNSSKHGQSISFATIHAKYIDKTIYISVSDIGKGFGETIGKEMKCKNELEAIIQGLYARSNSKVYGLYNVVRRVLEFNGRVRIHSRDVQLVMTPRVYDDFINKTLLSNTLFKKYNIKEKLFFNGVHIEIELPLEN